MSAFFFIPLIAVDSIIKARLICCFQSRSFSAKIDGLKNSRACFSEWISHIYIFGQRSWQENPILRAVSSLSPVNIHTLIWASLKAYITSGTHSYNLSSTLVAPIKIRSVSNQSKISWYFYSLLWIFDSAIERLI